MDKAYLILFISVLIGLAYAKFDIRNINELENEDFILSKESRHIKRETEQKIDAFDEGSGDDEYKVIPILKSENPSTKDLSGKELTELSSDLFDEDENLENLNTLILNKNTIEAIDKEVFKRILNLKNLSIKDNKLTSLETETFSDLTKLTELNLDKNPLELPAITHFLTTTSLRKLTMSECQLTSIPENTFDGMTGLEELDIGKNPISETTPITKGLFEPLSNLSTLILPLSASEALIKEVCKTHALLHKICVDECDSSKDFSCIVHDERSSPINDGLLNPLLKTAIVEDAIVGMKKISDEVANVADEVKETVVKAAESGAEVVQKVSDKVTNTGGVIEETVAKATGDVLGKLPGLVRHMPGMSEKAPEPPVPVTEKSNKLPEATPDISDKEPDLLNKIITTKSNDQEDDQTEKDITASSKSGVTSQGVNGPAIGIIVGIIILVVVGIILKKNWSKIKSKWDSNSNTPPSRQNPNIPKVRQSEEVPLKTNTAQDNMA